MDPTTVGTLLLNDSLPPELQLRGKAIDKKALMPILRHVAEKYPERYKEVLKTMNDVGRDAAFTEGVSVSLSGLKKTDKEKKLIQRARSRVMAIETSDLDPDAKKQAITDVMFPMVEKMQKALEESGEAENNPYWFQVKSGARGKMSDYNAIRGASGLVNDHRSEIVPIPILHSLSEGLDPVEYWAGTYGQRRGMIAVKMCLSLETLVLMGDLTTKQLRDIKPGDMVMGSDMHGNLAPTRVVSVYDNGPRMLMRYTFRRSLSKETMKLDATVDHKMLSRIASAHLSRTDKNLKKRPLSDARVFNDPSKNEYVCAAPRGGALGVVSEPRALFYGVMAGDGCCSPSAKSAMVSQIDPTFIAELGEYLSPWGLRIHGDTSKSPSHIIVETEWKSRKRAYDRAGHKFKAGGLALPRRWLEETGMWGKYAYSKTMPVNAYRWDNASMAAFIGGYFSCDGCVSQEGTNVCIRLTSTSENLVAEVRHHLLFRWGIHTTARPVKMRACMRRPQTCIAVSLRESVDLFAKNIPLIGKKREELQSALQSTPARRIFPAGFKMIGFEPLGMLPTADLEVEHPDHLYVLANGLISSNSTADAGFLSKKLANAAHRIVVNKDSPPMTRLPVGLPTKVSDADNVGAVLAKDAGAHKAGERITADILESLSEDGVEDILVHSPMTEPSEDGGVSRVAAGRRDRTDLSNVGDAIGIASAQSVGEPLSQATLNEKHRQGTIGKRNLRMGFEYLNRVIEAPETFPESGPLAEVDGVVKAIREAPQGGQFVTVDDRDYYLHPDINPVVKPGDTLEAGDDISDGAPHPEQLVRLRGIGEARRRYAEMLQEALTNHGIKTHRRNIETVVAGLLNWVKVTNPNGVGEHVVDDVASYNSVAGAYKARAGTKRVAPNSAVGKYLEEPVLHYTPGTRVTKKVSADLQKWGVKDIDAHDDDPDFQPVMQRGVMGVYNDNDWQTRLSGFYTSSGFLDSVHRSRVSDPNSTSYVPALAKATGFGDTLKTTGAYGTPTPPSSPARSPR
jgi:hypothetical protein